MKLKEQQPISRRKFMRALIITSLGILTACTGLGSHAELVDASKTPTSVSSPVSPSTNTPEPRPTDKPTENPAVIVDMFGLDSEREYRIQEDYLVDQYNKSPKAVRNDNSNWRKLDYLNQDDVEVMYGHLVPKNINYIDNQLSYTSEGNFIRTNQVYLGDVEYEDDEVRGQHVSVLYLMVGLRDGTGQLHVSRMGIDALGLKPDHWYILGCSTKNGGTEPIYPYFPVMEMLSEKLKPGDVFDFSLRPPSHTFPTLEFEVGPEAYPLANYTAERAMMDLYNVNKDYLMTETEWKDVLDHQQWPNRLVSEYADGLYIQEPDCR